VPVNSILQLNSNDIALLVDGVCELIERLRLEQPDVADSLDPDFRGWLNAMHTALTMYDRLTNQLQEMTS